MIQPTWKAMLVYLILIQERHYSEIDVCLRSNIANGVIDGHSEGPAAIAVELMNHGRIYQQLREPAINPE